MTRSANAKPTRQPHRKTRMPDHRRSIEGAKGPVLELPASLDSPGFQPRP